VPGDGNLTPVHPHRSRRLPRQAGQAVSDGECICDRQHAVNPESDML